MKNKSICFLFILLCTCSPNRKSEETQDSIVIAEVYAPADTDLKRNETEYDNEDCVFNNDYYTLTTEWLTELNKKGFIWRPDLQQVLLPIMQDTAFIIKGGCTHFTTSVELKLENDDHLITDSVFWMEKAYQLATDFKMDHYAQMIKAGKVKRSYNEETKVEYQIDDNDVEDNLYYNGIEIVHDERGKRITISHYMD